MTKNFLDMFADRPETLRATIRMMSAGGGMKDNDYLAFLQLGLKWVTRGDENAAAVGEDIYKTLGERNVPILKDVFTQTALKDLLTDRQHQNKERILSVIKWSLHTLESDVRYSEGVAELYDVFRNNITKFLHENGTKINMLGNILALVATNQQCALQGEQLEKFCVTVISCIAALNVPPGSQEIMVFREEVKKMIVHYKILWERLTEKEVFSCLKVVYTLISDPKSEPCPALCFVLELADYNLIQKAVHGILQEDSVSDGAITVSLMKLCKWLTWSPAMNFWILTFMKVIANRKNYMILTAVSIGVVEKLFAALFVPVIRGGVLPVLLNILIGTRHTETIFHKIVKKIPSLITALQNESSDSSAHCLQIIVKVTYSLMRMLPGYPDLYDPVLDAMKTFSSEQSAKRARKEIPNVINSEGYPQPVPHEVHQLMASVNWSDQIVNVNTGEGYQSAVNRSHTGYVGLANLGNTCYMNSALQALFMTQKFRTEVLKANVTPEQPFLMKLQILFSVLSFARRGSYSPHDFYARCRPPEFEVGRQQDGSEFLRYLLNGLHDQEKVVVQKRKPVEGDEVKDEPADVCMDITQDEGEVPGCSADDDMSMDVSPSGADENEGGGENEGDAGPLKRWTTEEDLSKNNILQTTAKRKARSLATFPDADLDFSVEVRANEHGQKLTDSHSDSTDSGIQSVGDSTEDGEQVNEYAMYDQNGATGIGSASQDKKKHEFKSLVQKIFGGKIRRCLRCLECKSKSVCEESFLDLMLAFPKSGRPDENMYTPKQRWNTKRKNGLKEKNKGKDDAARGDANTYLSIEDLIAFYLEPELFNGDNQYYCEKCKMKCDAEKTEEIVETPEHLILILSRFEYNKDLNRRAKLLTEIQIPETFKLPIKSDATADDADDAGDVTEVNLDTYALYAVVVHSGFNLDRGHFYTFARRPQYAPQKDNQGSLESLDSFGQAENQTAKNDVWCVFNDSHVYYSDFSNNCPRDSAYVLFYCKVHEDAKTGCSKIPKLSDLPPDVRKLIEDENTRSVPVKEGKGRESHYNKQDHWKKDKDDDDHNPPSSCGGGGGICGLDSVTRFVF